MFAVGDSRLWRGVAAGGLRILAAAAVATCLLAGVARAATPALGFGSPATVDASRSISAVACASTSFCAAADLDGYFTYTTDPTATNPTWSTPVQVDPPLDISGDYYDSGLEGLSCPSRSLCVGVDNQGQVVYITPGGPSTATEQPIANWVLAGVSCPSTSMCVAADKGGNVEVATTLTPSCMSSSNCAWTKEATIDATQTGLAYPSALSGIDCPSTTLCVAVDLAGDAMITTTPKSTPWTTAASVAGGQYLYGVSCDGSSACIAVDGAGDGEVVDDPTASTPTWSAPQPITPAQASAISCIAGTTPLCAVTDADGDIATTTDPTNATPSWTSENVDTASLTAVACPAAGSCVAGDATGDAVIGYGDFLTVAPTGAGSGSVTGTGATGTGSCPSLCTTGYPSSKNVNLTESPASGSAFTGWSGGGCSGLLPGCSVSVAGVENVTATFEPLEEITLALAGSGAGSVGAKDSLVGTGLDAPLDCSAGCSGNYAATTTLTLSETPAAGSIFTGWSGPCTGTGTCVVPVQNAATVTATFTAVRTLTVALAGGGSGVVTGTNVECPGFCSSEIQSGTSETLTATPEPGSSFTGWSGGGCSGTGTCTTTVSSNETVTASFSVVPPAAAPAANPSSAMSSTLAALTVTLIGSGSVAGNGIACPDECRDGYPLGATVTLSATPGPGYLFSGWSGGGCSGTGECTVTLAQSTGVTATFTATEAKILPAVSVLAVHAKALAFRDRTAKVALSCAGVKACVGTLALQLRQRTGSPKTIAKGRFHVAARHRKTVILRLSPSGVALLGAARHGYRVTLLVTGKTGQRLTVTLTARG